MKFRIYNLLFCVFASMLPFTVNAEIQSVADKCETIEKWAEDIMKLRQSGEPISTAMKRAPSDSESIFSLMVEDAYKQTKMYSTETRQDAIEEFRNAYFMSCYKELKGSKVDDSIIKMPVASKLTRENVEEAMSSVATELSMREVGILPFSEQVELHTDQKQRFLKVYQFAFPTHAVRLIEHGLDLSIIYPIRIALTADSDGRLWLVTRDLTSQIKNYKSLPNDIQSTIYIVNETVIAIMTAGATGDF